MRDNSCHPIIWGTVDSGWSEKLLFAENESQFLSQHRSSSLFLTEKNFRRRWKKWSNIAFIDWTLFQRKDIYLRRKIWGTYVFKREHSLLQSEKYKKRNVETCELYAEDWIWARRTNLGDFWNTLYNSSPFLPCILAYIKVPLGTVTGKTCNVNVLS